ncbi:MAG: Gfo/Idh/MocA family oxidoreductase [Dysgonamonadaceae bacterium]|jgi:predicted dehydrogenase|nr:Gfo/Idh/MocA family oxidoreductase [Dysgonamonadaceae bacterium]
METQKKYKWGIIGAARIANKFAEGLKVLPNAERYAIAARSLDRAEEFRAKHGFQKAFGSYAEMLADPELDAVYIATTNNLHYEHTMMCLEAGKAVLCEKPFASNLLQVKMMVEKAREKKVFLMEALWTRFIPSTLMFWEKAKSGLIGKPLLFQCDFGFVSPFDPKSRVYAPELGGGSVPDIGIYPVFTSMMLFGKPKEIQVCSVPAPTGTDWTTAVLFKHENNEISMLSSSFEMKLNNEARVYGEGGRVMLHAQFSVPTRLSFRLRDEIETDIPVETLGNGYNYEAAEVMNCLDRGLTESPSLPLSFSLDLMAVLDEICEKARPK